MRAAVESLLRRHWAGGAAWLLPLTIPLSFVYGIAEAALRRSYDWGLRRRRRVPVPVLVVGNVAVGGAGKTPVVALLALRFQARGVRIGVVSRGYGRTTRDVRHVEPTSTALEVGDEPAMLARLLPGIPIVVGVDRVEAITSLRRMCPDVELVILDDGLSHHRLQRDAAVVVVDAVRGLGNGRLLPAGPLRLPPDVVRDVSLVWISKSVDPGADVSAWKDVPRVVSSFRPTNLHVLDSGLVCPVEAVRDRRVGVLCGIAQPDTFVATVQGLGTRIVWKRLDADHAAWPEQVVRAWAAEAVAAGAEALVVTEKDAVRLQGFRMDLPVWVVQMGVEVVRGLDQLDAFVQRWAPPRA